MIEQEIVDCIPCAFSYFHLLAAGRIRSPHYDPSCITPAIAHQVDDAQPRYEAMPIRKNLSVGRRRQDRIGQWMFRMKGSAETHVVVVGRRLRKIAAYPFTIHHFTIHLNILLAHHQLRSQPQPLHSKAHRC